MPANRMSNREWSAWFLVIFAGCCVLGHHDWRGAVILLTAVWTLGYHILNHLWKQVPHE